MAKNSETKYLKCIRRRPASVCDQSFRNKAMTAFFLEHTESWIQLTVEQLNWRQLCSIWSGNCPWAPVKSTFNYVRAARGIAGSTQLVFILLKGIRRFQKFHVS